MRQLAAQNITSLMGWLAGAEPMRWRPRGWPLRMTCAAFSSCSGARPRCQPAQPPPATTVIKVTRGKHQVNHLLQEQRQAAQVVQRRAQRAVDKPGRSACWLTHSSATVKLGLSRRSKLS